MKTHGYKLRSSIKQWETRKATAARLLEDRKYYFPSDERPDLVGMMADLVQAERNVCRLQEAQARYNLLVEVDVQGERMTLAQAVKRLGGAGRVEKIWRDLLGGGKGRRSWLDVDSPPRVRKGDEERAVRTLSDAEVLVHAERAAKAAAALREAIAVANSLDQDVELDEALLL